MSCCGHLPIVVMLRQWAMLCTADPCFSHLLTVCNACKALCESAGKCCSSVRRQGTLLAVRIIMAAAAYAEMQQLLF